MPGLKIAARRARCWLSWMIGKPIAFYSDKHGIFRVNSKEPAAGDGVTSSVARYWR
jgi:hypothetical protein